MHSRQPNARMVGEQQTHTLTVLYPSARHGVSDRPLPADRERVSGRQVRRSAGPQQPACFRDLNLDQIVSALTPDNTDYDHTPVFWSPLDDVDSIAYRQGVFADLEREEVACVVRRFVERRVVFQFRYRIKEIREDDHGLQHYYRERLFLNAVNEYCVAVVDLEAGLRASGATSQALTDIAAYLAGYVESGGFCALHRRAVELEHGFDSVRYVLAIRGDRLTVAGFDGEPDFGEQVAATFARFQQSPADGAAAAVREWDAYAGTGVLDLIAQLYPDLFTALDQYCAEHQDYLDAVVAAFDRDVPFYLGYLDYIAPLRHAGLEFSYPRLSTTDKTEQALDTFDLALARKLHAPRKRPEGRQVAQRGVTQPGVTNSSGDSFDKTHDGIVTNDVTLRGSERILVISGPNNGGKTTLARAFGQLHYLTMLGCPVPGADTQVFVCDQIFTHFERAEDSTTLTGKLQSELNALRDQFAAATPSSVIILNEMFNSTTAVDALFLSREILERVTALDALCICVTFLDELASLNDKTVSMVSTVAPDDPATRTYKVVRRLADGRAYARAIADKYGLGFDRLVAELARNKRSD